MKKLMMLIFVLSLTVVFAVPTATKVEFKAKTGDKELDVSLSELNVEAKINIKNFNSEMVKNYKVSEKQIDKMRVKTKMQPADIYMALEVSKASGKPMEEVVSAYSKNKSKGWGEVSKKMGIKPGSKEFKALKNTIKERKQKREKNKVKTKEMKKLKNKSEVKPKNQNKTTSGKSRGKGKK